jgi:hypothetical protein
METIYSQETLTEYYAFIDAVMITNRIDMHRFLPEEIADCIRMLEGKIPAQKSKILSEYVAYFRPLSPQAIRSFEAEFKVSCPSHFLFVHYKELRELCQQSPKHRNKIIAAYLSSNVSLEDVH